MSRTFGDVKSPPEVLAFLEHQIKVNIENVKQGKPKYSICIWGHRGIGKTDIVKQLASKGIVKKVVLLPLAQIEEAGDIHGLPVKVKGNERTVTETAPPAWVPTVDEPGVLLLDDFNRADPRILKACMQLLLDGRTISWELPSQYTVVATANPEEDDYLVTPLDPAMITRMTHITMKADVKAWLLWATEAGVDSRVQNFIAKYPEYLSPEDERTCPRTWAMFADLIKNLQDLKPTNLLKTYSYAAVSEEAANAFIMFADGELEYLIEPEDICNSYIRSKEIREKVLEAASKNRTDILTTLFERLLAYLSVREITDEIQKNVIALLEEECIPKDIKVVYVNLLSKATEHKKQWIVSETLAKQLAKVV